MTRKRNAKCRFYLKKRNMIKRKHILTHIKMGKKILTFGDIEIERK